MIAHIVQLPAANLRDVPATLRRLAEAIEAGHHGPVRGCAVVLDADVITVAYTGDGEAVPTSCLLLHAGLAKVVRDYLERGQ